MPPTSCTISLVLIDDSPLERGGVVARLRADPGFRLLAASAEVEEALKQVRETGPDVVLLSLRRGDDEGLMLAGALHGEAPASRVVVMGLKSAHQDVAGYVRAGAAGFIMAGASFGVVTRTIQSVAQGTRVLPPELTHSLFGQLARHDGRVLPNRILDIKRLTERERAITDLIVQGLSNKEIAARLELALHTVQGHVHSLLGKLSVNSRLEVAAFSRNRVPRSIASPEATGRAPRESFVPAPLM